MERRFSLCRGITDLTLQSERVWSGIVQKAPLILLSFAKVVSMIPTC